MFNYGSVPSRETRPMAFISVRWRSFQRRDRIPPALRRTDGIPWRLHHRAYKFRDALFLIMTRWRPDFLCGTGLRDATKHPDSAPDLDHRPFAAKRQLVIDYKAKEWRVLACDFIRAVKIRIIFLICFIFRSCPRWTDQKDSRGYFVESATSRKH